MRLKTARMIALPILVVAVSIQLAAATIPSRQSQGVVDPHVSLRAADTGPSVNAIVDREPVLQLPVADQQAVTPEQLAQQETVRRQEYVFTANKAIFDGDRLKAAGELEAAAKRYEFAISHLSPGGQMATLYLRAATSLAAIKATWADNAIKKGNFEAAVRFYEEAATLDPNHDSYQTDLIRARRRLQETTGQPLQHSPPQEPRSRSLVPASRTRAEEQEKAPAPTRRVHVEEQQKQSIPATRANVEEQQDNNPLPPLHKPPSTINTRNHIADPGDMLN